MTRETLVKLIIFLITLVILTAFILKIKNFLP